MKLIAYIFLFLPTCFFGQLVTTAMSPSSLVQNVLLGPGVTISNVVFTGSVQAIAQFTAYGTNLGINEGIVITTGTVYNNGDGPQGPNGNGSSGVDNNRSGSNLLNGISSSTTFNAATLEFDFTAVGDSVSFKYVFGSEEYIEYVDIGNPQAYNDVFGLFISGPIISGGTKNIALLPNGEVVSINNVNQLKNTAYYVDNGNGNQSPFNSSNLFIQYDGFTRVLTAKSKVQCGQKYHLTIAIADVKDGILDSGIFLEAQSLKSKPLYETSHTINVEHFGNDTETAEGCTSVEVTVEREAKALNTNYNVPIIVNGTATENVDFGDIPPSLNFIPGQSKISFSFDIFGDGIPESDENIQLIIMIPNECGEIVPDTIDLIIRNIDPVQVTLANDTLYCGPGQFKTLVPIVTGGLQPLNYLWSTGETSSTIMVSPNVTSVYSLTVTDFCLNSTDSSEAEIYVMPIPPLTIAPIPDIIQLCPNTPVEVKGIASGGTLDYSYSWTNFGQLISTQDTAEFKPLVSTVFQLIVTDGCGLKDTLTVNYTVLTPLLVPFINDPLLICPGADTTLLAWATGGLPPYTFNWLHSGETSPQVTVNPIKNTTYTVEIGDGCATYALPISTTVSVKEPMADFEFSTNDLNTGTQIQFNETALNGVSYYWDLGNGTFSSSPNPQASYTEIGTYDVTLISKDIYGCYDTITKPIYIGHVLYIPNTFTPDGNYLNNEFFAVSINVEILTFEIFNRWGEMIYEANDETRFRWNGTYKGNLCPDGVYTYKIKYLDPSIKEYKFVGHVNLIR